MEQVYEHITAPSKEMLVFDLSHHSIFNEGPDEVLPRLIEDFAEYGGQGQSKNRRQLPQRQFFVDETQRLGHGNRVHDAMQQRERQARVVRGELQESHIEHPPLPGAPPSRR